MFKRFTAENTRNWINMLDKLMNDYNNRYHHTIKMTPTEASKKENEVEVLNIQGFVERTVDKHKFKVSDRVRISRIKGLFEKGYLPNWSEEVFEIVEAKDTTPFTYILKDSQGEVLAGSFYTEELQKTDQGVYRIEKILRKKKINGVEHGFVKWLGYNEKFNEWVPITDIGKVP